MRKGGTNLLNYEKPFNITKEKRQREKSEKRKLK